MMRPSAVRQMRSEWRAALNGQRQTRRAVARSVRRALHRHRAEVIASMRRVLTPGAPPPPPLDLDSRVLRVLERHPEGVRALDVGNELGLDWRRVLESTRKLVDDGLVEQVDQEFYLSWKASRRW
jgi:uncharacterized protein DUF802